MLDYGNYPPENKRPISTEQPSICWAFDQQVSLKLPSSRDVEAVLY